MQHISNCLYHFGCPSLHPFQSLHILDSVWYILKWMLYACGLYAFLCNSVNINWHLFLNSIGSYRYGLAHPHTSANYMRCRRPAQARTFLQGLCSGNVSYQSLLCFIILLCFGLLTMLLIHITMLLVCSQCWFVIS